MSRTDSDSFATSIGDTNSQSLEVSASDAERIHLYVDDGTTGNTPASYDLVVRAWSAELERYQFYFTETGRTDRAFDWPAVGATCEAEITNQSGGSATFEATLEARSR